mmetsp:Transcript_113380/g.360446  ORF Transcript_113380/g.360446 Transcript_113380/m.360446 type:complete len:670 (+) Transcript_113380:68-2077(+)
MVVMESETCRLEVVCGSTRCGDEVCCVGAPAALGQWNAIFAIPLLTDPSSFPTWAAPKFPLLAIGAEFKFVIRRQGGMVDWESFAGNRCWPPGVGRGGVVRVNYGEPTIKVVEAGSLEKLAPLPGNVLQPKSATSFRRLSTGRFLVHDDMVQTPFGCSSSASTVFSPSPNTSMSYGSGSSNPSHISSIFGDRGRVQDFYDTEGASLGSGNSGTVRVATNRRTSERRAIKTIHKLRVDDLQKFQVEIEIMKVMDHPNVIKLYEHFQDTKNFYLVMELCSGGDLFDHIISTRDFSETHAAHILKMVLKGVNYIHHRQVAHRDIKPENFLLCSSEPIAKNTLKIIDFGLSHRCAPGQVLTTRLGTPTYVAPEVLAGAYGQPADMWSCGVVLFVLLCGRPPFDGDTDQKVFKAIRSGSFSFDAVGWQRVSEEAKQFIRRLLCAAPSERIGASEALGNHWLTSTLGIAESAVKKPTLGIELLDRLRKYKTQHLLKKATLQIIAWRFLDHERIQTLEDAFRQLDVNGDGVLSVSEIRAGLEQAGVQDMPRDLQQIVDSVDTEGNGTINYTAFLAATMERRSTLLEDVLQAAFNVFDKDGDGKISAEELREVLDPRTTGKLCSQAEHAERIAEIIRQADKNGDGQIDFQEFAYMMSEESTATGETSPASGPKPECE